MISVDRIEASIRSNMCFVCSMCTNLYRGQDIGLKKVDGSTRCTRNDCCGPVGGGCFDKYSGELSREAIATKCHICGESSDYVLKPKDSMSSPVGVCSKHLSTVKRQCYVRSVNSCEIVLMIAEAKAIDRYEVY